MIKDYRLNGIVIPLLLRAFTIPIPATFWSRMSSKTIAIPLLVKSVQSLAAA